MQDTTPLETREHRFFQLAQAMYVTSCTDAGVRPNIPSLHHSRLEGDVFQLRDQNNVLLGLYRARSKAGQCQRCYSPTRTPHKRFCEKCCWSGAGSESSHRRYYDARF